MNAKFLTEEGKPMYPHSVFMGIKRVACPSMEELLDSVKTNLPLTIPVGWIWGKVEPIIANVTQIRVFTDGTLVMMTPASDSCLLKAWKNCIKFWIPTDRSKPTGILCNWESNSVTRAVNRQRDQQLRECVRGLRQQFGSQIVAVGSIMDFLAQRS